MWIIVSIRIDVSFILLLTFKEALICFIHCYKPCSWWSDSKIFIFSPFTVNFYVSLSLSNFRSRGSYQNKSTSLFIVIMIMQMKLTLLRYKTGRSARRFNLILVFKEKTEDAIEFKPYFIFSFFSIRHNRSAFYFHDFHLLE